MLYAAFSNSTLSRDNIHPNVLATDNQLTITNTNYHYVIRITDRQKLGSSKPLKIWILKTNLQFPMSSQHSMHLAIK